MRRVAVFCFCLVSALILGELVGLWMTRNDQVPELVFGLFFYRSLGLSGGVAAGLYAASLVKKPVLEEHLGLSPHDEEASISV